jgi:hypothetical protein
VEEEELLDESQRRGASGFEHCQTGAVLLSWVSRLEGLENLDRACNERTRSVDSTASGSRVRFGTGKPHGTIMAMQGGVCWTVHTNYMRYSVAPADSSASSAAISPAEFLVGFDTVGTE